MASDPDVADRDELLVLLSGMARNGSVSAARTLLEELRRDGSDEDDAGSTLDRLDNVREIRKRA